MKKWIKLWCKSTYWAYQDLGFSKMDSIRFLGNGFHPLTRQANLDKFVLHKAAGNHVYLEMDAKNFNRIKKMPSLCIVLSYENSTGLYKIDEEKSDLLSKWPRSEEVSSSRSLDEAITKLVDPHLVKTMAYVSGAYVHHAGDYFEIPWSVCILNGPDIVTQNQAVIDRLRCFDDQTQTWLPSEFDKRFRKYMQNDCKPLRLIELLHVAQDLEERSATTHAAPPDPSILST